MKKVLFCFLITLTATLAHAGPCTTFRDSCIKKGASKAHDGIHQCEWEEANAAKDQACISHLQKRYRRPHKNDSVAKPAPKVSS